MSPSSFEKNFCFATLNSILNFNYEFKNYNMDRHDLSKVNEDHICEYQVKTLVQFEGTHVKKVLNGRTPMCTEWRRAPDLNL